MAIKSSNIPQKMIDIKKDVQYPKFDLFIGDSNKREVYTYSHTLCVLFLDHEQTNKMSPPNFRTSIYKF